jgi:hypothetical protein
MIDSKPFRIFMHYVICFFILFGGIISNDYNIIKIHVVFNIFVILHWLTNNNKCFLSEYDHKGSSFIILSLDKIGINIDENNTTLVNIMTYSTVIIPLLYSVYRLNKMKKLHI